MHSHLHDQPPCQCLPAGQPQQHAQALFPGVGHGSQVSPVVVQSSPWVVAACHQAGRGGEAEQRAGASAGLATVTIVEDAQRQRVHCRPQPALLVAAEAVCIY